MNYNHWTGPVNWTDGLDWWNGLVDCKSDTYPEQFHTEKPKFTALVSFTVVFSYRISPGNAKDEHLKQLWCDLSSKKAYFEISETQTLVFSLQVGISGPPVSSSYYCCCSWL